MRRDARAHALGERVAHAVANLGEACERGAGIGTEDLDVDRCPQAQLGARNRRGAAEAAIPDGGHTGRETLRRAELRDVDELVPADPCLALDVQGDPLREVAEPVTEAAVDGVLEVRVRVDEARDDHRVVVARALPELFGGADRGDPAILDRDRAVLDRRALDRQDPVSGDDPVHGSVRLAASACGSACGARRSISTASQIEAS